MTQFSRWSFSISALSRTSLLLLTVAALILFQLFFPFFTTSPHKGRHSHVLSHPHISVEDTFDVIRDPSKIDLPNLDQEFLEEVRTVFVLPGGGSSSDFGGYPEWTKQRVVAAVEHYQALPQSLRDSSVFLALSAGSFNAPNLLFEDKRTMFECQHVTNHLVRLGIKKEKIFGDIFSWDTVTNGLTLRMFLEGLLVFRRHHDKQGGHAKVEVKVFISDFHAARAQAAFQWVLGLEPSLLEGVDNELPAVSLEVHAVDSRGLHWSSPADYQKRMEHEQAGLQMLISQSKKVRTLPEFQAFIMLGGHLGIRRYLQNDYVKSAGAGWS